MPSLTAACHSAILQFSPVDSSSQIYPAQACLGFLETYIDIKDADL